MKNNIAVLIFVRMSSKRLPGKVMKLIKKKTILEIIYRRVKKVFNKNLIIINTSNKKSDNAIVKFCEAKKINYYRGSLNNVFERTLKCCKKYNLTGFIRVCGDRPIFDYLLMKRMLKIFNTNKYDIVTNQYIKSCPKGIACEIVKSNIFYKIKNRQLKPSEKEHILNYFYNNHEKYNFFNYFDKEYANIKNQNYSIDNIRDFKRVEEIFRKNNYSFTRSTKKILSIVNKI